MYWLYLLLAFGALLLAILSSSPVLLSLWLLASLALVLAWARGFYRERVGSGEQDPSSMIDPAELLRLRELAQARRQTGTSPSASRQEPPSA